MTEVTEEIQAAVEETELPERLRERVYDTIEEREEVAVEEAGDIAKAVKSRYLDTRVDPLEPVGTVSAQSIGEPGTQMSIPGDEEVLVRTDDGTALVEIGDLVDGVVDDPNSETRTAGDHEVARAPDGLEALSLGEDEQVAWQPVASVSRHRAPERLLQFELSSGRAVTATADHSFVTRRENEVVPIAGEDLSAGDWLPVVADFGIEDATDAVDLREHLPASGYWFTSALTDGGSAAVPGGADQRRNKREQLESGDLERGHAYPVQGTVGLPEQFPLTRETGFFVGAFLAEGNATDHYVSISNVDPAFQDRIRAFAEQFDLSVNEYDNESGFAQGHDVRVNGTVLADFVRSTCLDDGSKVVPDFAYGAAPSFVAGLLGGYLCGDGNVSESAVRASARSGTLLEGIALLLARIGVHATLADHDGQHALRVPKKFTPRLLERAAFVGERREALEALAEAVDPDAPDRSDQIPNFGETLAELADVAGVPSRQVASAIDRQRVGRKRLARLVDRAEDAGVDTDAIESLRRAVEGDVVWDRIESIETVSPDGEYVYDLSVPGLETFTTASGVVTHNTMNTFHFAGVAEVDVTQGLPRLIELVDARKTPDTPLMRVYLEDEYATERERTHEVVWNIEATKILALGDISTNVADMVVTIDLDEETLHERWPTVEDTGEIVTEIADRITDELGVETRVEGTMVQFGPSQPSYRELLQLVEALREIVFKGIEEVSRVIIKKMQIGPDGTAVSSEEEAVAKGIDESELDEEFVLITEGSALSDVLDIEGVDATRTTSNNIHEVHETLGIEAAREAIIDETMETLEEQSLDDVNIRHLMLVADIMTNNGEIESIGRHGISGSKESVLARAAFEVTVSHLLDAAVFGEVDDLDGVTENVIVGKPIQLGTGDVDLRMSADTGTTGESADD